MIKFFFPLLLLSLGFNLLGAGEPATDLLKKYQPAMVIIEYYEVMPSTNSLQGSLRIKKETTGFLVDASGLIMTSSALGSGFSESLFGESELAGQLSLPQDFKVRRPGQKPVSGEFLGKDEDIGVAFIRAEALKPSPFITFTVRKPVEIGTEVYILANLGERFDYAFSAVRREVAALITNPKTRYLLDGNLPPDLAPGLVVTRQGQVLGIIMEHGISPAVAGMPLRATGFSQFLAGSEYLKLIAEPPQPAAADSLRKRWLGIYMQPLTRELADYFNLPQVQGILVNTVIDGSPAQAAGLQPGDIITRIGNSEVKAEKDHDLEIFKTIIREFSGDSVLLALNRQGQVLSRPVKLKPAPKSKFQAKETGSVALGFFARELTRDIILARNYPADAEGVWISRLEQAGPSGLAGLQTGDLLLAVDNVSITGIDQLSEIVQKLEAARPQMVKLFVRHENTTRFIFVKPTWEQE
jgi:serine protease Do